MEITALTSAEATLRVARLRELDRETLGEPWDEGHWLRDLPQKWRLSRLAVYSEEPYGAIIASRKPASVHIHRLVVDRRVRGKGVGTALLRAVAQAAPGAGCETLSLKVHSRNRDAIALYTALGFAIVATGADYLVMEAPTAVVLLMADARAGQP